MLAACGFRIVLGAAVVLVLAACPHSDDPAFGDAPDPGDGGGPDGGPSGPVLVRVGGPGRPQSGVGVTVLSPDVRLFDTTTGFDGTVIVDVPPGATIMVGAQFVFRGVLPGATILIDQPVATLAPPTVATTMVRVAGGDGGASVIRMEGPCPSSTPQITAGDPLLIRYDVGSCPAAHFTEPVITAGDFSGRITAYTTPGTIDLTAGGTIDVPAFHALDPLTFAVTGTPAGAALDGELEVFRHGDFRAPAALTPAPGGPAFGLTGSTVAVGDATRLTVRAGSTTRTALNSTPVFTGTVFWAPPFDFAALPPRFNPSPTFGPGLSTGFAWSPLAGTADGITIVLGNFGPIKVYVVTPFSPDGVVFTGAESQLLLATQLVSLTTWEDEENAYGLRFSVDRATEDLILNAPAGGATVWTSSIEHTIIAP